MSMSIRKIIYDNMEEKVLSHVWYLLSWDIFLQPLIEMVHVFANPSALMETRDEDFYVPHVSTLLRFTRDVSDGILKKLPSYIL